MLNAARVVTEIEFAQILARCGYRSRSPQASPVWKEWRSHWEWEKHRQRAEHRPIARYLSEISHPIVIVAVHQAAFQIYEPAKNRLPLLTCELAGNITELELRETLKLATAPLSESSEIPVTGSACLCTQLPQPYDHYQDIRFIGSDETEGRFGEVRLKQCKRCGRYWLHYFVEYEPLSESGRYFMGEIPVETAETMTPETAIPYLESLDWHLYGGSYFLKSDHRGKGKSSNQHIPVS